MPPTFQPIILLYLSYALMRKENGLNSSLGSSKFLSMAGKKKNSLSAKNTLQEQITTRVFLL